MSQPADRIVGVDYMSGDRVIVAYSNGTSAIYTLDQLATFTKDDIKIDSLIPSKVIPFRTNP